MQQNANTKSTLSINTVLECFIKCKRPDKQTHTSIQYPVCTSVEREKNLNFGGFLHIKVCCFFHTNKFL